MDTTEDILVIETPTSRFKKIITSRPATLIGAAVVGALSVVAVSALKTKAQVEGAMLVLEAEQSESETEDLPTSI